LKEKMQKGDQLLGVGEGSSGLVGTIKLWGGYAQLHGKEGHQYHKIGGGERPDRGTFLRGQEKKHRKGKKGSLVGKEGGDD